MKKMMMYLAFLIIVPGVVYAGANYLMVAAKDVYVVSNIDRDRVMSQRFDNFRLVWNDNIRKFELRERIEQRSIPVEQLLPFQNEPEPRINSKELAI